MAIIVGVRIKNSGKLFYFSPEEHWPKRGDKVIVETARGLVMGDVIIGLKKIDSEMITIPLKPVVRIATKEDITHQESLDKFAIEAFAACKEKIIEHKLDMKLVRVEPMFDDSKIMFYFTANQRIDFRDLVKDLATLFKTRIELRQIGVRDEAKIIGTLGVCGRKICCASWLGDFQPVSIKMAKEQSLSLNPTKISGACGRLMCCLKFEQDFYEQMHKIMPKVGRGIDTPDGHGVVTEVNVIRETVTVRIEKGEDFAIKEFTLDQINNPEKYKEDKAAQDISEFEQFILRSREAGRSETPEVKAQNATQKANGHKKEKGKSQNQVAERPKKKEQEEAPKQNKSSKKKRNGKQEEQKKPEQAHAKSKQQSSKQTKQVEKNHAQAERKYENTAPKVKGLPKITPVSNVGLKTFANLRRKDTMPSVAALPMPIEAGSKKQKRFQPRKGKGA